MVCVYLDMAVGLVLLLAVGTALRFAWPRSPNASLLLKALERMESKPGNCLENVAGSGSKYPSAPCRRPLLPLSATEKA